MMLSGDLQGAMVLHILEKGWHQPFVDGKANEYQIEEAITLGLYQGEIPPLDQDDVDVIISLVNDLIKNYGTV